MPIRAGRRKHVIRKESRPSPSPLLALVSTALQEDKKPCTSCGPAETHYLQSTHKRPAAQAGEPKATSTGASSTQAVQCQAAQRCTVRASGSPKPSAHAGGVEAPQATTSKLAPPGAARPAAQLHVPTVMVPPWAPLCGQHPFSSQPSAPAKPLERVSGRTRSKARVRRSALQP